MLEVVLVFFNVFNCVTLTKYYSDENGSGLVSFELQNILMNTFFLLMFSSCSNSES